MTKIIPFPQADNLEKVVRVARADESVLKNTQALSSLLDDVTQRQVNYYLSAAEYLGLVYNRFLTDEGREFRSLYGNDQKAYLAYTVFRNPVFYRAYAEDADFTRFTEILQEEYPDMNERVVRRRSQTGIAWIKSFEFTTRPKVEDAPLLKSKVVALAYFSDLFYGFDSTREEVVELKQKYKYPQDEISIWAEYQKLKQSSET